MQCSKGRRTNDKGQKTIYTLTLIPTDMMNICYASFRAFPDGRAQQPFLENDPANIVYALDGTYYSFYTLKKQSPRQLRELLQPYDLVIAELNIATLDLTSRIIAARDGRAATYSEGHIAEYQQLAPTQQIAFIDILRSAALNLVYWEKYVPFYRALTPRPVEYLPYPYLLELARRVCLPAEQRASLVAVPSGLAGGTRNGLATLVVAKRLLDMGLVQQLACWLEPDSFNEDVRAITALFAKPMPALPRQIPWRRWLLNWRIDYRALLQLKMRLDRHRANILSPVMRVDNLFFYRRTGWHKYLAQLAPARIMVDLNNRETVGRNALDCAALGIPCVSTARSDMQARLFPYTTLADCWDIQGAFDLCEKLLRDADFYHHVVTYAAEAIHQFDVVPFRARLADLLARHPEIKEWDGVRRV